MREDHDISGTTDGGRNGVLSTADVAARFGVTRRAVTQWAAAGRLPYERTDLGHHRYRAADVDALLDAARELSPTS